MKHKLRFYLGVVFVILAWILPLFGILVAKLPLSLAAKAVIIGLLTVGGVIFGINFGSCSCMMPGWSLVGGETPPLHLNKNHTCLSEQHCP